MAGPIDPDDVLLRALRVIGGYGHQLPGGSACSVLFARDGVTVAPDGRESFGAAYEALLLLEVGGRGSMQSGGGFIGGGFGLQGAAEGMIAASVLNALTTKTQVETLLSVATADWQVIFFLDSETPDQLRLTLAAPLGRLRAAQQRAATASVRGVTADLAAQLRQLAELHASGALTDGEFEAAKARLLA